MNVLNVEDIERELQKYAARALSDHAKRWVMTVARNYILSKLPEKDMEANFRPVSTKGFTQLGLPKTRDDAFSHHPAELPHWAVEAIQRGETLYWFDTAQPRRRELWNVLEVIVLWLNNWKLTDPRLPRVDRISFPVATNAAVLWYKDVSENIWNYVTDKPKTIKKYEHGFSWVKLVSALQFEREGRLMNHCTDGSAKIITSNGTVPIKTLVGKKIKVLTRNTAGPGRWVKAVVNSFGQQKLLKIIFERNRRTMEVYATAEHRWLAFRNRNKNLSIQEYTTTELKPDYRIPTVFSKNVLFNSGEKVIHPSKIGIMHGIVFGDGSAARRKNGEPNRAAKTVLYGHKDKELLKWFAGCRTKPTDRSIGGVEILDLPRMFKRLPSKHECSAYLVGWLAGYFAADGCVSEQGQSVLSSALLGNLIFAETLCQKFGIHVNGISTTERLGIDGKKSKLHTLRFELGTLPKWFFLLKQHRQRYKVRTLAVGPWIVKSVEPTDRTEEVFCATVPATGCFALAGNILTGNCVGNGSYYNRWRMSNQNEYFSLRDKFNKPHCTLEVSFDSGHPLTRKGIVSQCKGNSNHRPDREYQPYIRQFIADMKWEIHGDASQIDRDAL